MKFVNFIALLSIVAFPPAAVTEVPWQFENDTRYIVMGDSLGAGYGAIPQTQGYAYLLYKQGAFDQIKSTLLTNASVIGMTSDDVLDYQVPQAIKFGPEKVTLTVGGNDLFKIVLGADPFEVLMQYQENLFNILTQLCEGADEYIDIFVANLYSVPLPVDGVETVILEFNQIVDEVSEVVDYYNDSCSVFVADLYSEFDGQTGLLLIERNNVEPFQIHPTNAGHRAIAEAFLKAIEQ
jgi:lysophospholipase L1-like esterase